MLPLFPPLLLLFSAGMIFGIHHFRPKFAYHWLLAVVLSLAVWIISLSSRSNLPVEFAWMQWGALSILPVSFKSLFDQTTWSFSITLATLLLSSLLTSAVKSGFPDQPRPTWDVLAGSVALTGITMVVVSAGNLIFLQICWALADLVELTIWISNKKTDQLQKIAPYFVTKLISYTFLFWATSFAISNDLDISIDNLSSQIFPFVLIAVAIRLGVLPPLRTKMGEINIVSSQETVLRLATCAPGLVLLTRIAGTEQTISRFTPVMILTLFAALSAGLAMLPERYEPDPIRSNWVMGTGALVVGSTLIGEPTASLFWGMVLLLGGGLLLQFSVCPGWLKPLFYFAALGLLGAPLLFGLDSSNYLSSQVLIFIIFVAAQYLIIAGFFLNVQRSMIAKISPERWIWVLYIGGLLLLFFTLIWISLTNLASGKNFQWVMPNIILWISIGFVILLLVVAVRKEKMNLSRHILYLSDILSLDWLYKGLNRLFLPIQLASKLPAQILEGQSGILWAFLLLVLLSTLFSQIGIGE